MPKTCSARLICESRVKISYKLLNVRSICANTREVHFDINEDKQEFRWHSARDCCAWIGTERTMLPLLKSSKRLIYCWWFQILYTKVKAQNISFLYCAHVSMHLNIVIEMSRLSTAWCGCAAGSESSKTFSSVMLCARQQRHNILGLCHAHTFMLAPFLLSFTYRPFMLGTSRSCFSARRDWYQQ